MPDTVGLEQHEPTSLWGIAIRWLHRLHESEYNRRTVCGKTARTGLYRGRRVIGVPTVELSYPVEEFPMKVSQLSFTSLLYLFLVSLAVVTVSSAFAQNTQNGLDPYYDSSGLAGSGLDPYYDSDGLPLKAKVTQGYNQVSAGKQHTCALKTDNTIVCWGNNLFGQATPPAGSFKQVSAGEYHACAIKTNNTVACWGGNSYGQATPPTGSFKQVSAGGTHTCALKADNTIACWGSNVFGQASPPAGSFKQVSAGQYHACAIKTNNTVVSVACWGNNFWHQTTPWIGSFKQVSAGGNYACALKTNNTVACWGDNWLSETTTPPVGSFKQFSTGGNYACALKTNNAVVCWEHPVVIGGLGLRLNLQKMKAQATPPAGSFKQVSAGDYHACAIKTNNSVACWGNNSNGQATPPSSIMAPTISAVAGDTKITLNWTAVPGATSYNVYQGTYPGWELPTPVKTNITGTSVEITGLTNNTKYYFKMAAVNADDISAFSNEVNAKTYSISYLMTSSPRQVVNILSIFKDVNFNNPNIVSYVLRLAASSGGWQDGCFYYSNTNPNGTAASVFTVRPDWQKENNWMAFTPTQIKNVYFFAGNQAEVDLYELKLYDSTGSEPEPITVMVVTGAPGPMTWDGYHLLDSSGMIP